MPTEEERKAKKKEADSVRYKIKKQEEQRRIQKEQQLEQQHQQRQVRRSAKNKKYYTKKKLKQRGQELQKIQAKMNGGQGQGNEQQLANLDGLGPEERVLFMQYAAETRDQGSNLQAEMAHRHSEMQANMAQRQNELAAVGAWERTTQLNTVLSGLRGGIPAPLAVLPAIPPTPVQPSLPTIEQLPTTAGKAKKKDDKNGAAPRKLAFAAEEKTDDNDPNQVVAAEEKKDDEDSNQVVVGKKKTSFDVDGLVLRSIVLEKTEQLKDDGGKLILKCKVVSKTQAPVVQDLDALWKPKTEDPVPQPQYYQLEAIKVEIPTSKGAFSEVIFNDEIADSVLTKTFERDRFAITVKVPEGVEAANLKVCNVDAISSWKEDDNREFGGFLHSWLVEENFDFPVVLKLSKGDMAACVSESFLDDEITGYNFRNAMAICDGNAIYLEWKADERDAEYTDNVFSAFEESTFPTLSTICKSVLRCSFSFDVGAETSDGKTMSMSFNTPETAPDWLSEVVLSFDKLNGIRVLTLSGCSHQGCSELPLTPAAWKQLCADGRPGMVLKLNKIFLFSWQLKILADFPCDLHFQKCIFQDSGDELLNPKRGQPLSLMFESSFPFGLAQSLGSTYIERPNGRAKAWKKLHLVKQSLGDKEAGTLVRFLREFDLPVTWMPGGSASSEGVILEEIQYKKVAVKSVDHLAELLAVPKKKAPPPASSYKPPVLGEVTLADISIGKFVYVDAKDGKRKGQVIGTKKWGSDTRVGILLDGEDRIKHFGLKKIALTKTE